ncbi:MAG TPA: hypothetical protein VNH11_21330 [Pirellulales bacterium]|nr:hypothetical protein [Pirellulales bacterium]
MKRLLILTALALLTASTAGCWRWFNRGAQCNPCATGATGYPATEAYPAASTYTDPCMGAPSMESGLPGPMTTVQPAL